MSNFDVKALTVLVNFFMTLKNTVIGNFCFSESNIVFQKLHNLNLNILEFFSELIQVKFLENPNFSYYVRKFCQLTKLDYDQYSEIFAPFAIFNSTFNYCNLIFQENLLQRRIKDNNSPTSIFYY